MKIQKVYLTFLLLFISLSINAQQADSSSVRKELQIKLVDATTGEPVPNAKIMIESVGDFTTDNVGQVTFPQQPNGILKVIFQKNGFISAIYRIEIAYETIQRNRLMVSPLLEDNHYRFVLSWDKLPEDLDAHFTEKKSFHISYRYSRVLNDGTGQLERDDMDGYGPESINVSLIDLESEYLFYVTKYLSKKNPSTYPLYNSKATVWVYGNNRLLNVFQIPTSNKGDTWNVFKIVNGEIVEYNQ